MSDTEEYLKRLDLSNGLRSPLIKNVINSLQLSSGSKGLDAGCGNGYFTLMLAEAAGVRGHVTGLDVEEKFLVRGRSMASKSGLKERVTFIKGDIRMLPFNDNAFEWAVSIDLIGYAILQVHPATLLKELARVVKPGGMIYILMWSSQMLLPGYPVLEARLNSTSSGIAPFDAKMKPELHYMHALEWFKQAGLIEAKAQTFVGDINPPISKEKRNALLDLFEMRWGKDNPELSEDDQLEYRRLCSSDSPDCILDIQGYYGFFTYSLFQGNLRNKSD